MRSRWKATVVALAAVCALGVVGVTSASATLPEFVAKDGSHGGVFTVSIPEKITMHTVGGFEIQCKWGDIEGELSGSTGRAGVQLRECQVKVVGKWYNCQNRSGGLGGLENWIEAYPVNVKLGYVNKASKEVGIEFEGEGSPKIFANKIHCALLTTSGTSILGEVIGKIGPVNTMTKKYTLEFAETGGVQKITGFEGGPFEQQLGWQWEPGGSIERLGIQMTGTGNIHNAAEGSNGEGEIKA